MYKMRNFYIPTIIYLHSVVLKYHDWQWIQVKYYKAIGNGIMHKLTMV